MMTRVPGGIADESAAAAAAAVGGVKRWGEAIGGVSEGELKW